MSDIRKVEILKCGGWEISKMIDIKNGDIFRLFEPDGTKVVDSKGSTSWIADGDSFINNEGITEVNVVSNESESSSEERPQI